MNSFINVLNQFSQGLATSDELTEAINLTVAGDPQQLLSEYFLDNKIPPQLYFSLKDRIENGHTAAAENDSDKTLLAAHAGQAPNGETRIHAAFDSQTDQTCLTPQASPVPETDATILSPAAASRNSQTSTVSSRTLQPDQSPGKTLGIGTILKERFVLEEILGSGGMGVVYKALDLRKQEAKDKSPHVALKILNDDIKSNATSYIALQRETRKAQTLAHPNIITVYDFDRPVACIHVDGNIIR